MSHLSRRTFLTGTASLLAASACSTPGPVLGASSASSSRPFDRARFVDDVKRALPQGQEAVAEVIARAVSEPASIGRDLGDPRRALIQPLYKADDVSIFNIVWPPLAVLVPHDHLMWASIGVYSGREDNIMWRRSGGKIKATTAASVGAKEVFSLPSDAIHSVANPVEAYTAAIHVYGGNLAATRRSQWDPLSHHEEPFDLEEGRRILNEADRRFSRG